MKNLRSLKSREGYLGEKSKIGEAPLLTYKGEGLSGNWGRAVPSVEALDTDIGKRRPRQGGVDRRESQEKYPTNGGPGKNVEGLGLK